MNERAPLDIEYLLGKSSRHPFHGLASVYRDVAEAIMAGFEAWANGEVDGMERLEEAINYFRELIPPVDADYDPRPYIEANHWQESRDKSHSYCLIQRSTDWREHFRFLEWIRVTGEIEFSYGSWWRFRTVAGYRYWALGTNESIINRRVAPDRHPSLFPELEERPIQ